MHPSLRDRSAVEVCSACKHFGSTVVLSSVTLRVVPGEVVALMGSNGAGKTTLLSLLLGLCKPTRGLVRVCGLEADHPAARLRVGGMIQGTGIPGGLRVAEILALYRKAFAEPLPAEALMALTGLAPRLDCLAARLSAAERQRLLLGLALIGNPVVAILDEPSAALDGPGRDALQVVIRERAHQRGAVIFSTHRIEEAQTLADRVLVLANGGLSCSSH